MCGIVGYIGREQAAPILYEGLKRLEYRGYDSAGIATLDGGYHIKKDKGKLDEINGRLELGDLPGSIGIGHTRWATHGIPSKRNAHPHEGCKGEIVLVHNGIISNYLELREELKRKGHEFVSETDTESLVHLIEETYENDLEGAVRSALKEVEGTYAILVLSAKEPDRIVCARKESPLLIGIGEGEMFAGSDITSFLPLTKMAVPLDDGELAVIKSDSYTIKELETGRELKKEVLEIGWDVEMAEKGGYAHFMLKEIHEQPQTVVNALNIYPQNIGKLADMIEAAERTYIIGAGTSLHSALVAEYWLAMLCGEAAIAADSSELKNLGVIDDRTLVIGITQSGETYDTLAAMRYAKSKGAKLAAVVNVIGSTATREADHAIMQNSGIEICVCATKTFTSQLVVLLRVAIELARRRDEVPGTKIKKMESELERMPELIKEALDEGAEVKRVAEEFCNVKNYIYIGKGINLPTALEGALKFKEITYNHAEGMSGGLLKHGTISLIDEKMHTIAIVPGEGENRSKITSNIQEVKARGGFVIGFTSGEAVEQCDVNILAPKCSDELSPILLSPLMQLLAYYTAVKLGRDVDKPRALAKSVTVE